MPARHTFSAGVTNDSNVGICRRSARFVGLSQNHRMPRYAAKLLLAWSPDPVTNSQRNATTEERILTLDARSATSALRKANALGKRAELRYVSGHRLVFIGVLQLLELDEATQPDEVWWEFKRRSTDPAKLRRLLTPPHLLWAFTDERRSKSRASTVVGQTRRRRHRKPA